MTCLVCVVIFAHGFLSCGHHFCCLDLSFNLSGLQETVGSSDTELWVGINLFDCLTADVADVQIDFIVKEKLWLLQTLLSKSRSVCLREKFTNTKTNKGLQPV